MPRAPGSDPQDFDHHDPAFIADCKDVKAAAKDWQTFTSSGPDVSSIPSSHARAEPDLPIELVGDLLDPRVATQLPGCPNRLLVIPTEIHERGERADGQGHGKAADEIAASATPPNTKRGLAGDDHIPQALPALNERIETHRKVAVRG